MNYYEVLGLKIPSPDDIKKAYYKAVKEFHPDIHVELPEEMKSKLLEIYTYITNAYLSLIDPEQRRAYDKCIHSATFPPRRSMGQETEYPIFEKDISSRVYHRCLHLNQSRVAEYYELAVSKYNEGKDEFRKKNYKDAAHLCAMAIYFDRSVAGFHYYGCPLQRSKNCAMLSRH
ncbi:MAG: DnaJ domain-containing protein [Nitrospiraceae bacterium]|nr:MAG: DnaJ domain-containing protein [Nitrospiraceae bacterium]